MSQNLAWFGMNPEPLLIVISGPSGVGKDAVVQRLKERNPDFHFVVTANTRLPRHNEVHGVDYFFYSKEEFQRRIDSGEFFEYTQVYNDYKGIPRAQVVEALDSGCDVVMRVDVQGAATVKKKVPSAILIFLTTASEEELVERLRRRRTDSEQELEVRIETAHHEYQRMDQFDYKVVNREGELDKAVDDIHDIINAERHRVQQHKVSL